jgi:hypothetical protein
MNNLLISGHLTAKGKIKENLEEVESLKKRNLYSLNQIKNSREEWEKKEYIQVIKMNNKKILELAEHNRKLGGFR